MNGQNQKKIEFTELEQELYDVLLDEYNDIFENILNLEENQIFNKILINSKAILGPNKMQLYSEENTNKIISYIKTSLYDSDLVSLKPLKNYINSFSKKIKANNKLKLLEIDDIFAHCRDCSQCYHICGQILQKFTIKNDNNNFIEYIICIKCKMVYKKNLIHLYCKECQEEYYSYIFDDSEPDYENYYPATWEKYHCPNFIYEEMTCPKCDNMLYYNEKIQLLKCFECNWKCNANNKKWRCELCNEEFISPVKEYVRFETKPKVNCVRDALVEKVLAMPPVIQCCEEGWDNISKIGFRHVNNDNTKNCNGIYYLGHLQNKKVVVCSECRLVQQFKDVYWQCPNCSKIFRCKKRKERKTNKNKINNISKYKSLLKDEKSSIFQPKKLHGFYKSEKRKENKENFYSQEKKIINNFKIFRKMDSNNSDDFEPVGKIISKRIKPKNINNKYINLAKVNINININKSRSNNDDEDTIDDNNSQSDKEEHNHHNDDNNSSKEKKPQKFCKNKNKFSFYKKPKNILYNNIIKIKKKEKDESISFNRDISENYFRITKNNINSSSMVKKKDNKNLSLKEEKVLSLRNQKYISIGKFHKSSNENSLIANQNFPNSVNKNRNYKYNQIKTKLIRSNKKINLNINVNNFANRSSSNNKSDLENNLKKNSLDKNDSKEEDNIDIEKDKNNSIDSLDIMEGSFNIEEFKFIKQIGEGTFGKIYSTQWNKNNKEYAMKKMFLKTKAEIKRNKEQTDLVFNFLKKTGNNGVVKIYGSQCKEIEDQDKAENKDYEYNFYVLMELADIDWEKEINNRKLSKNYYTEGEIYKIMRQLIKAFSELQKNYITHRDIKPQNILIVNNNYKIGDFGEAKITEGNNIIKQSIKGTELYMSPILFTALNKRQSIIIHNTFKSDVFSLGMCLFLASTLSFKSLYDIREVKDSKVIKKILEKYLIVKYSYNFVNILVKMLEVDENLRPDFIELENDFFYK